MADTTVKKIDSRYSPTGELGQVYLATGTTVGMRLWDHEEPGNTKPATTRDYETVGFVIDGKALLKIEEQEVVLERGDSWVVPRGASHAYRILEPFTAVEATSPPADVSNRDAPQDGRGAAKSR